MQQGTGIALFFPKEGTIAYEDLEASERQMVQWISKPSSQEPDPLYREAMCISSCLFRCDGRNAQKHSHWAIK